MDFFRTIFDGLVGLSEKFPSAEVGVFAIAAFVALVLVAVVIGLTFLGSGAAKFKSACRRVLAYLDDEQSVGDDNVADFTAECFGAKTPSALREAWVQFLGVRFGYPSEIISEQGVFEKAVKRGVSLRANIYIGVALIVTAFFAFWGLGSIGTAGVGVVLCCGLLLAAVGYIVLVVVARKQYDSALEMFREMQDALDAKVVLQVERDYSADASPLLDIASVLEGIVSRNTARPLPEFDFSGGDGPKDEEGGAKESESAEEVGAPAEPESEKSEPESNESESASAEDAPVAEDPAQASRPEATEIEKLISAREAEEAAAEVASDDIVEDEEKVAAEEQSAVVGQSALAEETETIEPTAVPTETVAESPQEGDTSPEVAVAPVPASEAGEEQPKGDDDLTDGDGFFPLGRYGGGLSAATLAADAAQNEDVYRGQPTAEEVNQEYEDAMFGRKKKQQAQVAAAPQPQVVDYDNMEVEAELIADDNEDYVLVRPGVRPASLEGLNIAVRPASESSVTVSLEPEIVYVEENLDEGDEDVKAPRLAKLPHLVDYVLTMKISRGMKIRVAMLMLQAYNVFKNSPENKAIVIQCMSKIIQSIMADRAAEKAAAEKAAAEAAAAADKTEGEETPAQ